MGGSRWVSGAGATLIASSLIAKSAALLAEVAAAITQSRALLARGHERRLSATYSRLRPIAGGIDSNTSLIIEVLINGPACLECLVKKTGVPAPKVTDVLQQLEAIVVITGKTARCDGCLRLTPTYQFGGHTHPTPRSPLAEALWRFLTEHRGEMFCALCLATSLGVDGRLDRVLVVAEGRGARRHHGRCSRCRKDRLLCGLSA